jgi:hypothetical protein
VELASVRRRLRGVIEQARHAAADRRVRRDAAFRDYENFLEQVAVPTVRQFAAALAAEGHSYSMQTPSGSVRLVADHPSGSFIELALDDTVDVPVVVGRTTSGRGRRMITSERPLRDRQPIADLVEEDVLDFLLAEIVTLLNPK